MKFVITPFFEQQIGLLSKKYKHFADDFADFQHFFVPEIGVHLWSGIYKVRRKNSSIPTGKRGGFRFVVKVHGDIVLPLIVYSKRMLENVSAEDIEDALEKVLREL